MTALIFLGVIGLALAGSLVLRARLEQQQIDKDLGTERPKRRGRKWAAEQATDLEVSSGDVDGGGHPLAFR